MKSKSIKNIKRNRYAQFTLRIFNARSPCDITKALLDITELACPCSLVLQLSQRHASVLTPLLHSASIMLMALWTSFSIKLYILRIIASILLTWFWTNNDNAEWYLGTLHKGSKYTIQGNFHFRPGSSFLKHIIRHWNCMVWTLNFLFLYRTYRRIS